MGLMQLVLRSKYLDWTGFVQMLRQISQMLQMLLFIVESQSPITSSWMTIHQEQFHPVVCTYEDLLYVSLKKKPIISIAVIIPLRLIKARFLVPFPPSQNPLPALPISTALQMPQFSGL